MLPASTTLQQFELPLLFDGSCCKITHWFGRGESVLIGFANKSVTWFSGMFVLGHKEVYLEYNREE